MASPTILPEAPGRALPDTPRVAASERAVRGVVVVRAALLAAWTLAFGYFVLIAWFALAQHWTFHTRARDMGIYAQVMWNTSHGRPFSSTLLQDNTRHVAEHIAPVLAIIAPLYALVPSPALLLVIQQLCLAASGLPIFFYSRARLGDGPALALLAAYYAMPAMSRVALSEFHPIVMAALPMSLGVKAVLEGRARAAVAWLLLGLLFEEETAPLVGAAGAYLWLRHRRAAGFALGAFATAWLLALILVVMPSFHDRRTLERVEGNRSVAHFEQVQENPAIVLDWLVGTAEPSQGAAEVETAGGRGRHAALWLLAPTAGLSLLAPGVLAIAAPSFALLFLADRAGNVAGHWAGATLPVFWFAAAAGLATLARWAGQHRVIVGRAGAVALLLATAVCYRQFSLFPGGGEYEAGRFQWTDHEADLARAVALAPPDVRLDATRRIVPHLANRAEVYQWPSTLYTAPMRPDLGKIDAFVFDLTDSQTRRALDPTDQDTVLTKRPRLHVRSWGDDVILATRERPMPATPSTAVFGGVLRLDGHDLERSPTRPRLVASWEPTRKIGSWTRVAELVGPDGSVVARVEGAPLSDVLPPSKWERGQVVSETADFPLPTGLAPGTYRLTIGWLDQQGRPVPVEPIPGAPPIERYELATISLP